MVIDPASFPLKMMASPKDDGLPTLAMINEQTSIEEEQKESRTDYAVRRRQFDMPDNTAMPLTIFKTA